MNDSTIHNPDRFMIELRQILAQGRKRVGLLLGAGAPLAVRVDGAGQVREDGDPLIPDVAGLTRMVLEALAEDDRSVIKALAPVLGENPNVETILTRVRRLAQAIGTEKVYGLDEEGYKNLAERICSRIGEFVSPPLPIEQNAFTELVAWIGGTHRGHPVEIFTPNYDLLIEEAFERAQSPFFDGFSGAHRPFFDPASIRDDTLPARWSRLWKIHGSLGWEFSAGSITRTGSRKATNLIYPDHLKYDHITRQPFSAYFDRLHSFLTTPDSLLLCSGFSFSDAHITAVIDEALAVNNHTAVIAFQYRLLQDEAQVTNLALRRPNLSVYARDGAIIFGVKGAWKTGRPPTPEWENIRGTFWKAKPDEEHGEFLLGDFARLSRFFALAQISDLAPPSATAGTLGTVDDQDGQEAVDMSEAKPHSA